MKAILVVDMPERCWDCPYGHDMWQGEYRCLLDGKTKLDVPNDERSEECPLKPMPSEKYLSPRDEHDDIIFQMGWNGCIDEILGETE